MFKKIAITDFPPKNKPLMVYDGKCGFCKYWVVKWKKLSGLGVDFKPYQEVHHNFEDIPEEYFKEAVRFISTNGKVYTGPDAAYITYYNKDKVKFLHNWYNTQTWFMKLSDWGYQLIADNRSFMSKISIWLFGKNPANPKPYWKYYLLGFIILVVSLISWIV